MTYQCWYCSCPMPPMSGIGYLYTGSWKPKLHRIRHFFFTMSGAQWRALKQWGHYRCLMNPSLVPSSWSIWLMGWYTSFFWMLLTTLWRSSRLTGCFSSNKEETPTLEFEPAQIQPGLERIRPDTVALQITSIICNSAGKVPDMGPLWTHIKLRSNRKGVFLLCAFHSM